MESINYYKSKELNGIAGYENRYAPSKINTVISIYDDLKYENVSTTVTLSVGPCSMCVSLMDILNLAREAIDNIRGNNDDYGDPD